MTREERLAILKDAFERATGGLTRVEAAEILGIDDGAISTFSTLLNIARPKAVCDKHLARWEYIKQLHSQGWCNRYIAIKAECTHANVTYVLKKYGLTRNPRYGSAENGPVDNVFSALKSGDFSNESQTFLADTKNIDS